MRRGDRVFLASLAWQRNTYLGPEIYTQYIYLATSITSDNVIFKTVYIVIDILQGPNNFNHNFILNLNLQGSGQYSERYSRPKDSRRA